MREKVDQQLSHALRHFEGKSKSLKPAQAAMAAADQEVAITVRKAVAPHLQQAPQPKVAAPIPAAAAAAVAPPPAAAVAPSAEPKASPVMGAKDAAAKVDRMINAGATTQKPHYDVERRMAEPAVMGKGEVQHMQDEAAEVEAEAKESPQELVEEMEEEEERA